jgi:hypothetical protein
MATSETPVDLVQNPAFGALLFWSFGKGFQGERVGELPQLTQFFLVLPLILHGPTLREIKSTNLPSGLSKMVSKLSEHREKVIAIHDRSLALRNLTLQSIACALAAKLIQIDYDTALVRANEIKPPPPPERLKFHIASAEKLGRWFSRLPQAQVFALLQVEP